MSDKQSAIIGERERFVRFFQGNPIDRPPFLFFGAWPETKVRWKKEGCPALQKGESFGNDGPTLPGMDGDWESAPEGCSGQMWNNYGLAHTGPIAKGTDKVIREDETTRDVETALGAILRVLKKGGSIPQHIRQALEPTEEDWDRFKRFLDIHDPQRRPKDWKEKAKKVEARTTMSAFIAGSLYGNVRDWMGVEEISCLMIEEENLFSRIVNDMADFYLAVNLPILEEVSFELAYFFEDCCFNTGPLFSPEMYLKFFHEPYQRMISAYKKAGAPLVMLDSDGRVDSLIPLWIDSGFDVIFPIEVGTWQADPIELHKRFGARLKMFGGFNKHLIPQGIETVRRELKRLKPLVDERVLLPIPDHRIPPDCSWKAFQDYISVYHEVYF
jgi:uroporphyrinogen decarboxylase